MADNALGNILTRLQGLKNVSGRRVMEDPDFLYPIEGDEEVDVSGIAQLPEVANFQGSEQNLPQEAMVDTLGPQSDDVRANVIEEPISPKEQLDPGLLQKLGSFLSPKGIGLQRSEDPEEITKSIAQAPPIETEQVQASEGLPLTSASEEIAQMEPNIAPENQQLPEQEPQEQEPGTYVELGAANHLYNDPSLDPEAKMEIERIFDTKLSPQRAQEVAEMEKVTDAYIKKLQGVEVALTAREKQLLDKVANRDLTTSQKLSMAMAIVAPAIIGALVGGKAGFFSGLTEGGKSISNLLQGREKEIKEADELLPSVALEKANISKEHLKTVEHASELKRKINESVPNHALRNIFTRDGKILNGKLVLDTGNPLLPLKSSAIRTEKDYENFKEKLMPGLANKVSTTEQGLHLLDNLRELVDVSDSQNQGGLARDLIPMYDVASKGFKALIPAGRDEFVDENGHKVKISELYETVLEQLSDAYSQAVGAAGSKTAFKTYREHFREMLPNPFTLKSFTQGKTKLDTVRSQINSVKSKFEDNIVKNLDSAGVETSPVKELFGRSSINKTESDSKRKKNRAQEAVNQVLGK